MSDNITWENSEHCLLASHNAKDGVEGNSRAPAQGAYRETLMGQQQQDRRAKAIAYPTPKGPRISVVMR